MPPLKPSEPNNSSLSAKLALGLAIILPPIGFVWSLVVKLRSHNPKDKSLTTIGMVLGAVLFVPFCFTCLFVAAVIDSYAQYNYPSPAKDLAAPVVKVVEARGGTEVCGGAVSLSGRHLLLTAYNTWPSFKGYYLVQADGLSQALTDAARETGFELHIDPAIDSLKTPLQIADKSGTIDDEYLSTSNEREPRDGDYDLMKISILRNNLVSNPCSNLYGKMKVPKDKALVSIEVTGKALH